MFIASFEAVYYHLKSNLSEAQRMELIRVLKQVTPSRDVMDLFLQEKQEMHED